MPTGPSRPEVDVRNRLRRVGCALAVLGFLQCGPGDPRTPARSDDASTLTVLYPTDEWGLGPVWSYPSQFLVFLPLVERDARGELQPLLARAWEHSADYREWTIHLRTGVRWHDGIPVTAHDVAFTLGLWEHPAVALTPPGSMRVTVLDDSTYTLGLDRQALGTPLDDYTVYYPRHLLQDLDPEEFNEWPFWKQPVGNGPYRFARQIASTGIELEANADYFRGPPPIKRIVLKFGPSNVTELLSGSVDILPYFNLVDVPLLADDPRFQVTYQLNLYRSKGILWNQEHRLFRDRRARRALTSAIDRKELRRLLNYPDDAPLVDVLYSERQLVRGELPDPVPFDREQAIRTLRDLGWEDRDDDGVLDRDGDAFAFTCLVAPGDWARGAEQAAVYVQDQLRRIGVRMNIQTLEATAARERIFAGDFQAAINDIATLTRERFFGAASPMGYRNPDVIRLISEAHRAIDPEIVDSLYRESWPHLQRDLPVTFLFPAIWATVAHRRVRGLSSPYRAEPAWYAEHLTIAKPAR